jgi:hypothetical protein
MRLTKLGLPLVSALLIASSAFSFAIAGGYRHVHHGHGLNETHRRHFGGYRPLYGYYTRHGEYVPGAGDRLIYGPGYVFVPGHGILGEDCNMSSSTCTNEYRDIQ